MPIDPERFTTELPDHLLCEICLNVSYPPMVLCAQEHIACEDCLTKIQASPAKDKCPMCQQAMLKPTRPCLALKRAIEGYEYTCRYDPCRWTGAISDEKTHADSCDYGSTRCYRCDDVYVRKNLLDHLKICPFAWTLCPAGGRACPGKEEDHGFFMRRDLQGHLDNDCTQRKCRVTKGCKTRTTYANLPDHEAGCSAAAKRVKELEEALCEQTAKSKALEATLQTKEAQADDNRRSDRLYTSTREYWLTGDGTIMSRKRTLDILTDSPAKADSSPAHATSASRSTIDHLPDASSSKKQRRSSGA